MHCTSGKNCNEQYRQDLVCLCENITRALRSADEIVIPRRPKSKFTPVPVWKRLLEEPYIEERNADLAWCSDKILELEIELELENVYLTKYMKQCKKHAVI